MERWGRCGLLARPPAVCDKADLGAASPSGAGKPEIQLLLGNVTFKSWQLCFLFNGMGTENAHSSACAGAVTSLS